MTPEEFEEITGTPLTDYAFNCHVAAHALVTAEYLGPDCRVARGWAEGVPGQHSWVVLGNDCYADDAQLIDPTLWSYQHVDPYVWEGSASDGTHVPHGSGNIWEWGRPDFPTAEVIELDAERLTSQACLFLDLLGPLDRRGWGQLANAPVGGWPSAEIIGVMFDDPRLTALVPIDIVGMLTDRNPGGLYLPRKEVYAR